MNDTKFTCDVFNNFRTAKLWIQYLKLVSLLKNFITADRTGDWKLHLKTITEMLPYLAAAGHNNYVKSCRVYLQDMHSLKLKNPDINKSFENGLNVIRRTDRYWGGSPPDLVIEQELMRSMKSSGTFF